jgi:UDP-2,3-diacylglucosamine pyrophosphatase LpxH
MKSDQVKTPKRKVDLIVISDVHLGTYGCHARELVRYMKSIKPKEVVLNGDIIDIWQFSKSYWPKSHMQVIKQIISWASKGTKVHYITGNHDELLRRFEGFEIGSLKIENKLILELNGKKAWIFHGDVFDVTMQHARWLTRLGSVGYDLLIYINAACNWTLQKFGKEKISLSKKIKNSVKQAVKFINHFEDTAAGIAIENNYDYVVCGHIHQPEMRTISNKSGSVEYLNSGDWVENLTALEYHEGKWTMFNYREHDFENDHDDKEEDKMIYAEKKEIFSMLFKEIQFSHSIQNIK